MTDHAAVLFANESFYVAFAGRDMQAMETLWAQEAEVTCVHPGWEPVVGREDVLRTWEAILGNPDAPKIACHSPIAHVFGDAAYVVCYEVLEGGFLAATNVFVREGGAWRLVHHQAGASPPPSVAEDDAGETMQ